MAIDPLQQNTNPAADPVHQLAPKAPGQPSHDDHDTGGPPAEETIKRGYEKDVYDVKTVLSVPALVVFFFVAAFGITTVLFTILSKPIFARNIHPQAEARNQVPLPDRIDRLGRGREVDQPRLDQLPVLTGEARAMPRPKAPLGNSPQVHPEEQDPSRYPERYPELQGKGPNKGGVPLDKSLAAGEDVLKVIFKSSGPALPGEVSRHTPGASNAGRGAEGSVAAPPEATAPKAKDAKEPKQPKGGENAPTPRQTNDKKEDKK